MIPLKSLSIFLVVLCALSALLFIIYYSCVEDQLRSTASNAVDKIWLPHLFLTHDKIHGILFANKSDMSKIIESTDTKRLYHNFIRSTMSIPDLSRPVNLSKYDLNLMKKGGGQTTHVVTKLSGRRNGFFIESGAYDGETMSNTLYLEMALNWTGLLIEPAPLSYRKILTKNRRAVVFNGCLSPAPYSEQISFLAAWMGGGIVDYLPANQLEKNKQRGKFHEIRCFPLSDLLASLGVTHVDYWNLDIEGAEPGVLANFNWNHTTVDVVGIEPHTPEDIPAIRRIMTEKGMYKEFVSATKPYQDMMFERI